MADLSGNHAPQAVSCHPWEPQETVPPILHPTTPAPALSPSRSDNSIALQTAVFLTPNSWPWLPGQFREIPAHPRETTSCSDCDLQAAPQMANNLFSTLMKTNETKKLLRVCCVEALPGERNCLAPWGVDGEVRSMFFPICWGSVYRNVKSRSSTRQHQGKASSQQKAPQRRRNHIIPCTGLSVPRRQTDMELVRAKASGEGAEPKAIRSGACPWLRWRHLHRKSCRRHCWC